MPLVHCTQDNVRLESAPVFTKILAQHVIFNRYNLASLHSRHCWACGSIRSLLWPVQQVAFPLLPIYSRRHTRKNQSRFNLSHSHRYGWLSVTHNKCWKWYLSQWTVQGRRGNAPDVRQPACEMHTSDVVGVELCWAVPSCLPWWCCHRQDYDPLGRTSWGGLEHQLSFSRRICYNSGDRWRYCKSSSFVRLCWSTHILYFSLEGCVEHERSMVKLNL